jgi:osmotically-inducible protein OsmY
MFAPRKLLLTLPAAAMVILMAAAAGITQKCCSVCAPQKPVAGCPTGGPIVGCMVLSDDTIRQQVEMRLRSIFDPKRGCANVNVVNGVVCLTGSVTEIADIELATFLASSVRGVSHVCNQLTLLPKILLDSALVEQVTRAIGNAPYKVSGVKVDVTNGVANLTGWVDTEYVREQVGAIAGSVPGIGAVHNYLMVKEEGGTF